MSRNLIIGVQRQHCTHLSVVAARIGGRRKVRGIILLHNKQQLAPAAMVGVWSTIKFKCNNVARGIKNERMRSVRQPIFLNFLQRHFLWGNRFWIPFEVGETKEPKLMPKFKVQSCRT